MSGDNEPERSPRLDTRVAHPARVYNYWLGGKDNFAADRASGDAVEAAMPTIRLMAMENRRFLGRAARFLAEQGVRQFLDIGTGIPAPGNTHEVVQAVDPTSKIVYVDNDPIVLSHARALLTSAPSGTVAYLDADLRDPRAILDNAELRA
ncbi:MAG TPA: SAM-dependent methyltransferase, partial [Streptosporangiaceae bacterium]